MGGGESVPKVAPIEAADGGEPSPRAVPTKTGTYYSTPLKDIAAFEKSTDGPHVPLLVQYLLTTATADEPSDERGVNPDWRLEFKEDVEDLAKKHWRAKTHQQWSVELRSLIEQQKFAHIEKALVLGDYFEHLPQRLCQGGKLELLLHNVGSKASRLAEEVFKDLRVALEEAKKQSKPHYATLCMLLASETFYVVTELDKDGYEGFVRCLCSKQLDGKVVSTIAEVLHTISVHKEEVLPSSLSRQSSVSRISSGRSTPVVQFANQGQQRSATTTNAPVATAAPSVAITAPPRASGSMVIAPAASSSSSENPSRSSSQHVVSADVSSIPAATAHGAHDHSLVYPSHHQEHGQAHLRTELPKPKSSATEAQRKLEKAKLAFQLDTEDPVIIEEHHRESEARKAAQEQHLTLQQRFPDVKVQSGETETQFCLRMMASMQKKFDQSQLETNEALHELAAAVRELKDQAQDLKKDQDELRKQVRALQSTTSLTTSTHAAAEQLAREQAKMLQEIEELKRTVMEHTDLTKGFKKDVEAAHVAALTAREATEEAQIRWIDMERKALEQYQLLRSVRDNVTVAGREMNRVSAECHSIKTDVALLTKRLNARRELSM